MHLLHHSRGWPAEVMVSVEPSGSSEPGTLADRISEAIREGMPSQCPTPTFYKRFAGGESRTTPPCTTRRGKDSLQDALVFVGNTDDGRTCLKLHPEACDRWVDPQTEAWKAEALSWQLEGGDVLVLDGLVLLGNSLHSAPVELPDCLFGKRWMQLKSHYPVEVEALAHLPHSNMQQHAEAWPLPFFHLDLFLTAIEDEDRVVFFLGYLVKDRHFEQYATEHDRRAFCALYRCLEGLVRPLEALKAKMNKAVELRRLPVHLGRNMDMGISFCNGVLAYEEGKGCMTVLLPDEASCEGGFHPEDVQRSREIAARALHQVGIRLQCIESSALPPHLPTGGLSCRTKVLRRVLSGMPAR